MAYNPPMETIESKFITWYFNVFSQDELFRTMDTVTEGSPHHREGTVAIHTNMVVGQFLTMPFSIHGAFACAFHDVGKPSAMEADYSEERGKYYRFRGHELISARLWEDWAVRNWTMLKDDFGFWANDIYAISWIIENHLPWGIKKSDKRRMLALSADALFEDSSTFTHMVTADTWGRISDDAVEKRMTVAHWCSDFRQLVTNETYRHVPTSIDAPILYMLIGASGSGKSTFVDNMENEAIHYSWDDLRLRWYDSDDYANAFKLACEDKDFMNKANKTYTKLLETQDNIVVDNINVSRKRRAFFIACAKNHGYRCVAVLFPVQLETILSRQESRGDKSVPAASVQRQYMSVSMPSFGEFDDVIVHEGNLEQSD